jgi:tetratricopeptide (TPR) repeat protein
MDSIKELERRWYFYKIKQSLLSLNSVGFVVMLTLGGYYSYLKSDAIMGLFNEKVLIAKSSIKAPEVIVEPALIEQPKIVKKVEKPIKSSEVKEVVIASKNEGLDASLYEVSLEPVIPIVDMERESKKRVKVHKKTHKVTNHTDKSQRKMVKAKASTYLTASELLTIQKEISTLDTERIKKINLNASSVNYIETMKNKFLKSKKPREALLLAKAFYTKGEYRESEKWALTANKLDSSNDESWHIFAKSKLKLGQKNEALKILSSYYKKSHSSKTKALIVKIKTGRL